jgi:hypothetical protein
LVFNIGRNGAVLDVMDVIEEIQEAGHVVEVAGARFGRTTRFAIRARRRERHFAAAEREAMTQHVCE